MPAGVEGGIMIGSMVTSMQVAVGLLVLQLAVLVWFGYRLLAALELIGRTVAIAKKDMQEGLFSVQDRMDRLENRCMMVNLGKGEEA